MREGSNEMFLFVVSLSCSFVYLLPSQRSNEDSFPTKIVSQVGKSVLDGRTLFTWFSYLSFFFFFNILQGTQIAAVRKEICEGQKATDGRLCGDRTESTASTAYLD